MSHSPADQLRAKAVSLYNDLKPRAAQLTNKDRRAIPQQDMPSQDPALRVKNMQEVTYGYSKEQAVVEALRCFGCKNAPTPTVEHFERNEFVYIIGVADAKKIISAHGSARRERIGDKYFITIKGVRVDHFYQ